MGSDWQTVKEQFGIKLQALDRWAARSGQSAGRSWRVLGLNGAVLAAADEASGLAALMAETRKMRILRAE